MRKHWRTFAGLLVAIVLIGCVVDEDNDAIKPTISSSVVTPAPNVTFTSIDGTPLPLSKLAGKVVYVDFWGTDCPPCIQSLPFTQRLNETFKDKGLEVITVTSSSKDAVTAFLTKHHFSLPTYLDGGPVADSFKVDEIPHTFIIDRAGNIVHDDTGLTPQAETIKQLAAAGLDTKGFEPKDDPTAKSS